MFFAVENYLKKQQFGKVLFLAFLSNLFFGFSLEKD